MILVVLPTRELAIQVNQEFTLLKQNEEYTNLAVYGGTEIRSQIYDIKKGVDIVVGTPGRIIDMLNRSVILTFIINYFKVLDFSSLKAIVLDEADEMLNMGFQEDVEKIYKYIKYHKIKLKRVITKSNLETFVFSDNPFMGQINRKTIYFRRA